MGVATKPNWGRSYPVQRTEGPPVELVRLRFDTPRDITLYLNANQQLLGYPNLNPVSISFGSGGTASTFQLQTSVLGTVLHVVAQTIDVRSPAFTPYPVDDDELSQLRVSAMAGLGRPTPHERRLFNDANSNPNIAPGASQDWELDAWVYGVKVNTEVGAGATLTGVTVQEVNVMPPGETLIGFPSAATEWTAGRVLHPLTNVLRVVNGSTGTIASNIVQLSLI